MTVIQQLKRRRKMPVWKSENYEKLQTGRELRVLVIKSGRGLNVCECSLRRISLDDKEVQFEALSYTWGGMGAFGGTTVRYFMCLGGYRFDITRKLFWALRFLRYADRERTLWVDTVCINQANIEERNQQVKLMGRIYTTAKQVDQRFFAWLHLFA